MHPVLVKTFGGLSRAYYIRQFLFGLIFPAFTLFMMTRGRSGPTDVGLPLALLFALNTLLYPYARFVYESAVGFVMGNNVFFVNAFLMLFVKAITMLLCWAFAIFIAPIGLIYLYFHHSKAEQQRN
ncbi:hypothetical protein [Variovorax paradoxus]|uniref:hypothetical protein n=1 Tax=Variovorax paradoxus TaxID=34073 RepID=UPI00278845D1|nr:hypothetical protein [Variovorax paradoxus]MDQ0589184.1 hypothetical protein [Variovorax paradoxus]